MSKDAPDRNATGMPGKEDWLRFAATPVFATMAVLTTTPGDRSAPALCSAMQGGSPMSGMVVMYGLMSALHVAPWITLVRARFSR